MAKRECCCGYKRKGRQRKTKEETKVRSRKPCIEKVHENGKATFVLRKQEREPCPVSQAGLFVFREFELEA